MRKFLLPVALVALTLVVGALVFDRGTPSAASVSAKSTPAVLTSSSGGSAAQLALGKTLFEETCSTCHGVNAGGSALAPNLRGVGSATVDLWISSGWMPLAQPTAEPIKKPALFDRQQTVAIANYVASLTNNSGIAIPSVNLKNASVAEGFDLFSLNCAPCHTITGAGDALSNGLSAPPLHGLSPEEVTEAIITGPQNMPRFSPGALTKKQVADVVAYVTTYIEHPSNPGGLGLGGVGPVAEGFIGLFVGVGACMLAGLWIGERTRRSDEVGEDDQHGDGSDPHGGVAHA
jgi:ubiquinol-cytochrome c reductase cytochrome c subunit